ncbi:BTB/POZ domain-containing protein 6-B-like [Phlebotomus papatasi]|uniref:BTB/POZ domain-containing protein 6-B-like n=1 Tax=Phlebotomus papatasi TaxID=29031 RepID=UPI0024843592|nr:BTB/POZ domain-containing protein 6-B-like [Phlebotomus papatasi]
MPDYLSLNTNGYATSRMETNSTSSIDTMETFWSGNECIEERLSKFICNEFLSDMIFVVGKEKKRVPGHKFILNSCSWQFYNAFNLLKLDKDELSVEDVSYESFLGFLSYCYTGKVVLGNGNAFDIYKLAQRFQIDHLLGLCEDCIFTSVSKNTCMELYSKSTFLEEDSDLKIKILNTIEENFSYLIQDWSVMKIFVDLPLALLREIVALEHLQSDEMELFDALMKWATQACYKIKILPSAKNLRKILCDVFYKIRFPAMKMEWFVEILAKYPEMLTPHEISNISHAIRGDVKVCSKFNHNPRRNNFPMLRNSMKLEITEGTLVPCYLNTLQMMNISTSAMSIKFRGDKSKVLLGYGFIAQKGHKLNIISCKIKQENSFGHENLTTSFGTRYKLSWDYDLIIVRFGRKQSVMNKTNNWYELCCTFDKNVAHLSSESLSSFGEVKINEIYVRTGQYAIIPYLVFE